MAFFKSVVEHLSKSGLIFRGDPPKVVELNGREWGEEAGGFVLSIQQRAGEPPDRPVLSVILRNIGPEPKRIEFTDWLHFFKIHTDAPKSAFGARALVQSGAGKKLGITSDPGKPLEIELPIGLFYKIDPRAATHVTVSCEPSTLVLTSNGIFVK